MSNALALARRLEAEQYVESIRVPWSHGWRPGPAEKQLLYQSLHLLKPTCFRCNRNSNVGFRYINNYQTSIHFQARYKCGYCRKLFPLYRYNNIHFGEQGRGRGRGRRGRGGGRGRGRHQEGVAGRGHGRGRGRGWHRGRGRGRGRGQQQQQQQQQEAAYVVIEDNNNDVANQYNNIEGASNQASYRGANVAIEANNVGVNNEVNDEGEASNVVIQISDDEVFVTNMEITSSSHVASNPQHQSIIETSNESNHRESNVGQSNVNVDHIDLSNRIPNQGIMLMDEDIYMPNFSRDLGPYP